MSDFIKVSDQYSIKRYAYGWELHYFYMGKSVKGKEPKIQSKVTYHNKIDQMARRILNNSAGECTSIQQIVDLYSDATKVLSNKIATIIDEE